MDPKLIKEINMLAKKQKEGKLTESEMARQAKLRKMYLDAVKVNFKRQLDNIKFTDGDGVVH